jgi:putative FmdB family regulatory protein
MPTYEYTCRDCGHRFDIVQSMWDEPLTMCPECGGTLRKVFAPPAISFKGSGFYATDHRRKAAASAKSGDAAGDGPREGTEGKGGKGAAEEKGSDGGETKERSSSTKAGPKKEPAAS